MKKMVFLYALILFFCSVGVASARFAPPPSVPEPSTMILMGCGIVGLIAFRRRKK